MKIISRYMVTTVVASTAVVLMILLGIMTFVQLLKQIDVIGTRDYGLWQAVWYVLLYIPQNAYQLFPMAALVGSLIGLGRLAEHSELMVIRTSGVSVMQLVWTVIKAAFIMLVVVVILGEVVGPAAIHTANKFKSIALTGTDTLSTHHGTWLRSDQSFVHIDKMLSEKALYGITRLQFNPKMQLVAVSFAQTGAFENGRWIFKDIVTEKPAKDRVIISHIPQQSWPIKLNKHLIGIHQIKPNQISLLKLSTYIHFRRQSGLRTVFYEYNFYWRLLLPFATIVMILLGIPFILGPLRSVSMGLRIVAGTVLGFGYYMLNQFFGPFSIVYQLPPLLAASLPTVLFALLLSIMLYQLNTRRLIRRRLKNQV